MTRQLSGQDRINIRQATRLVEEEREKYRTRRMYRERSREQWDNSSFVGKISTILVAVGALVVFGMFQDKSPSSGEKIAPASVLAPAVAPANDTPSSGAGANMVVDPAATSLAPRSADIASDPELSRALTNTPSPAQGTNAPEQSVNREPSFIQRTAPLYPPQALRQRHEGTTLLEVAVSERGKVENVSVEKSSGYRELGRAALQAARNWSFKPAIHDGQPAASVLRTPVKFSLNIM